jgi:hypothetical protein
MAKSNPKANGYRTQALFKLSEVCNDLDKHEDDEREGVEGIASPDSQNIELKQQSLLESLSAMVSFCMTNRSMTIIAWYHGCFGN